MLENNHLLPIRLTEGDNIMSKRLILDSSELSQWHTLVNEAEQDYGCHLDEAGHVIPLDAVSTKAPEGRAEADELKICCRQALLHEIWCVLG